MKFLSKGQLPILLANIFAVTVFTGFFVVRQNYEFLIYIAILVFFAILVLATNKKVRYSNGLLWGLSLWAFAHMAGGGIYINGIKLYEKILIPIVGDPYHIFKYDQLVHIYGFGIGAFLIWHILKPLLAKNQQIKWVSVSIIVIMGATGLGALNEVIEFIATVFDPQNGVGGYTNNAIDLVANLIGATIAMVIIYLKEKSK